MASKLVIENGVAKNAVDEILMEWGKNETLVIDAQWINLMPDARKINQVGMDVQFVPEPEQSYLGFGIPVVVSRDTVSIQITVPGFSYEYRDLRIWVETELPGGIDKKMLDVKVCLNVTAPDEPEWSAAWDGLPHRAIEDLTRLTPVFVDFTSDALTLWSRQLTYRTPNQYNKWRITGFREGGIVRDPRDPYRLPKVEIAEMSEDGGAIVVQFSGPLKPNRVYFLSIEAKRGFDDTTLDFDDILISTKMDEG